MKASFALLLFALLAVFLNGCGEKQVPAYRDLPPELSQDTINLGEISSSIDTFFSVMIFNPENAPVTITAKAKSCGCTRLEVSADTIPARGYVTAKIGFNGANMAGAVTKSVFFRYDTGEISIVRILADINPI